MLQLLSSGSLFLHRECLPPFNPVGGWSNISRLPVRDTRLTITASFLLNDNNLESIVQGESDSLQTQTGDKERSLKLPAKVCIPVSNVVSRRNNAESSQKEAASLVHSKDSEFLKID